MALFKPVTQREWTVLGAIALVLLVAVLVSKSRSSGASAAAADPRGPEDAVVLSAWQAWYASDPECQRHIQPVSMDVRDKSKWPNNMAEVTLLVRANWISTRRDYFGNLDDPGFYRGPCNGFKASRPNPQLVHKAMRFVLEESGWRFVGEGQY